MTEKKEETDEVRTRNAFHAAATELACSVSHIERVLTELVSVIPCADDPDGLIRAIRDLQRVRYKLNGPIVVVSTELAVAQEGVTEDASAHDPHKKDLSVS